MLTKNRDVGIQKFKIYSKYLIIVDIFKKKLQNLCPKFYMTEPINFFSALIKIKTEKIFQYGTFTSFHIWIIISEVKQMQNANEK